MIYYIAWACSIILHSFRDQSWKKWDYLCLTLLLLCITWEKDFGKYFDAMEWLVYCYDAEGLIKLFIGSLKTSLKATLLHYGNVQSWFPMDYSASSKESYKNMKLLLLKN